MFDHRRRIDSRRENGRARTTGKSSVGARLDALWADNETEELVDNCADVKSSKAALFHIFLLFFVCFIFNASIFCVNCQENATCKDGRQAAFQAVSYWCFKTCSSLYWANGSGMQRDTIVYYTYFDVLSLSLETLRLLELTFLALLCCHFCI